MINDLDIATIVAALYVDQAPGYWTRLWPHDNGMCALKRVADKFDVVVWRGSETGDDWLADLDIVPTTDPVVGEVHYGFLKGVLDLQHDVIAAIARPAIICGHSLGAAHALIHAGFLYAKSEDVQRVTTFGSPCPGGSKLQGLLAGKPGMDYKNRSDPVTDVPVGFGYVHPRPLISVDVEPSFSESGILGDHHMHLYLEAMEARYQPSGLLPAGTILSK